jgi:hypothetical protein
MSNYINPKNESKEDFLAREAKEICRDDFLNFSFPSLEKTILCLVNNVCPFENAMFSACAVANCHEDAVRFTNQNDTREKKYYLIDRSKLDESVM